MHKSFNNKLQREVTSIYPGELYVSAEGEAIHTILGSCVSVCLYDPINKLGGMNHFMLPLNNRMTADKIDDQIKQKKFFYSQELRYGTTAMEVLIGELQKAGGERKHFQAKLFGGGNVLNMGDNTIDIGGKNIKFVRAYMEAEGIPVHKEDLGESYGRKIFFLTDTFKVLLKRMLSPAAELLTIEEEEKNFSQKVMQKDQTGEVDLF